MPRVTAILTQDEKDALAVLAIKDHRKPYHEAGLIIRRELERCGLLQIVLPDTKTTTDKEAKTDEQPR